MITYKILRQIMILGLIPVVIMLLFISTLSKSISILFQDGYFWEIFLTPLSIIPRTIQGYEVGYFKIIFLLIVIIIIILSIIQILIKPKWWIYLVYSIFWGVYLLLGVAIFSIRYI